MKILHSFLLCIFPALFIYSHNYGTIPFDDLFGVVGGSLAVIAVILLLVTGFTKDLGKSAILISSAILLGALYTPVWLCFGIILGGLGISLPYVEITLLTLLALFGGIAVFILRKPAEGLGQITIFLNIVGAILVASSVGNGLISHFDTPSSPSMAEKFDLKETKSKPNIYYIILDAYGRADSLNRLFSFDNSLFLNELKTRGFYLASESTSNYPQTISSIASTLNYEYLQKLLPDIDPQFIGRRPLKQLIEHSRVFRYLSSQEYRSVSFETGVSDIETSNTDIHFARANGNALLDEMLSILDLPFIERKISTLLFENHKQRIFKTLTTLEDGIPSQDPLFVYAHIMLPHPPFIFDRNGVYSMPKSKFSYGDGDHYGDKSEYPKQYIEQLQYLNARLIKIIDAIKSREPNSIVILQGDHGTGYRYHMTELRDDGLKDRFQILNAYLIPGAAADLYPSISPVNSFRVVLRHLFGEDLKLLADRSYFTGYFRHYNFIDVTEKVRAEP